MDRDYFYTANFPKNKNIHEITMFPILVYAQFDLSYEK